MSKGRVTGIGGIFFLAKDPDGLREWYGKHLGMATNQYGSLFEFGREASAKPRSFLQWSTMNKTSTYFQPSTQPFMINYRVDDMEALLQKLGEADIKPIGDVETYEYGTFAHIMDPAGNKIELWEPVDDSFAGAYPPEQTTHD